MFVCYQTSRHDYFVSWEMKFFDVAKTIEMICLEAQWKLKYSKLKWTAVTRQMLSVSFYTSWVASSCTSLSLKAFGVGALEEDDDDIFSQESMTSYHTSLALPSDNEQPAKYGWTGGKEMGGGSNDAYQ